MQRATILWVDLVQCKFITFEGKVTIGISNYPQQGITGKLQKVLCKEL